MIAALEGGEWSAACPSCTLPPGKIWYPFYRRLGGAQGRSGQAENLIPTGIQSRTVQPLLSRYKVNIWYYGIMLCPSIYMALWYNVMSKYIWHYSIMSCQSIYTVLWYYVMSNMTLHRNACILQLASFDGS